MSLIKIRGRTILAPILNEEQRAEARALREKAILYQQRLEEQRNKLLQQCNYKYQQQQQSSNLYRQHQRTQTTPGDEDPGRNGLENRRTSIKPNKNYIKNESTQTTITSLKKRNCGETSSSSAPSSQGSGGELTSEGLEDSPSAANVSVQTESSESVTTSTDLHHYLNNSHDNSLDTSISVSHDIWRNTPSLIEVDEALLQTNSPEVATNLILGRLHPSAILNGSSKPAASREASQNTETTSSTLVRGHQSSGKHTMSDGQDTTTMASVTLSFASVSEGSEEGLLDESEELLDISEEDKDTSFPSELDSDVQRVNKVDSHKYSPKMQLQEKVKSNLKGISGSEVDDGVRSVKEKWKDKIIGQQDSGRGTSHSDYLDSYLELLTNKSGSSQCINPVTSSLVLSHDGTLTATYSNAGETVVVPKISESVSPRKVLRTDSIASVVDPIETSPEEGRTYTISKDDSHNLNACGHLADQPLVSGRNEQNREISSSINKENDSTADEIEDFSSIENDWQKELLLKPRASSATPERKERKRSRTRRWSSCQPLDPRRSVGSKYLDSYLGKLTDDAWLQYPTQLSDRRMIYLSSDEYINAVRPKPIQKSSDQQFTSTDMSETSASEENKNLHTSSESLHSSVPEGTFKEAHTDRNATFSLVDSSVIEQPAMEQALNQEGMEEKGERNKEATNQERSLMEGVPGILTQSSAISEKQKKFGSQQQGGIEGDSKHDREESSECLSSADRGNLSHLVSKELPSDNQMFLESNDSANKQVKEVDDKIVSTINDSVLGNHNPDKGTEQKTDVSVYDPQKNADNSSRLPGGHVTDVELHSAKLTSTTEHEDGHENTEGQESSSEASSETEPSTIVYLEDFLIESPSEGKSLLSSESEEKCFLKAEKSVNDMMEKESLIASADGMKLPRKEASVNDLRTLDVVSKTAVEPSLSIDHSIKLITSQKNDRAKAEKLLISEVSPNSKDNPESSTESDEECLVVQVTVNPSTPVENNNLVGDSTKTDYLKKTECVKDSKGSMNLPLSKTEHAQEKQSSGWELFPEEISKDAVGQVLSLLKAKQQQELEELKMRQQKETHHIIEKLQRVSPQQLQAFLTVSSVTERRPSPNMSESNSSMSFQAAANKHGEDSHSKSDRLDVKRPGKAVSPQRNSETQRSNIVHEGLESRAVKNGHENGYQFSVPSVSYPVKTTAECIWTSSATREDFVNSAASLPSVSSAASLVDHTSYTPNTAYPTSSLSLTSESMSSSSHSAIMSDSYSSCIDQNPESPKPKLSNHTNLMPSYFRYEENTISAKVEKYDTYRAHSIEQRSSYVESDTRPQSVIQSSASLSNSGYSVICCSAHMKNNNPETVDTLSYINGNCLSYGDGMQYYRLFTGDEDSSTARTTSHSTEVVSYQPRTTETVVQPGLFRVIGNSPRPTSITSLLKEHPEMFGEEVLEVNVEHEGNWTSMETELGDCHGHPVVHTPATHHSSAAAAEAEGGLDMVPERESAAAPSHRLSENWIFIRGITRLQACVRRYMTQRLLRTKFVQEQLSTLTEIAKLTQQFHRDILTDNIQKGDVDFHKTLYNQERIARERIRRVFLVLTVQEQMSLIHRDRQLWYLEQERRCSGDLRTSPAHTRKNRSALPVKPAKKTSPPGPRSQQQSKIRTVSSVNRVTALVQPALVHQPQSHQSHAHTRSSVRPDHRASPRGSRLPVHVPRSSSTIDHTFHPQYQRSTAQATRSPSQDSRSSVSSNSRSGSQPPRSNSTPRLCGRTSSQQSSRGGGQVTGTSRTCTIRNPTNRVTPPRAAAKTSVVGRRPWR